MFPRIPQIVLVFVLTNIGWLFFRERETTWLLEYLSLSPLAAGSRDWTIAGVLATGTLIYSAPLWLHALYDNIREKNAIQQPADGLYHAVNAMLVVGILCLHSTTLSDFIYFRF